MHRPGALRGHPGGCIGSRTWIAGLWQAVLPLTLLFFLLDLLLGLFFLRRFRRFLLIALLTILAFAHGLAPLPLGALPAGTTLSISLIGDGEGFNP